MLLKTPTAALQSCSPSVAALCSATLFPPASRLQHRRVGAVAPARPGQRRSYASVHDGQRVKRDKHDSSDPPRWPTSAHPTPYEIFGLARNAPYSKARYFQLAKLYHPDRHHHTSGDGISHVTKLERYRLVVAANELLSNPQKKRMYDLYGFGWENQADSQSRHREADRAWRQQPGNASMNATWEDWERWYRERDGSGGSGEKQEQIFTSNLAFMAIISTFLIIGTWGQMTRAGANSVTLLEMRDQQHVALSNELRERRNQRAGLDREARVESFLRQRELERWAYDPPGHGLPATAHEENETLDKPSRLRS
ncbi:997ae4c3-f94f-4028-b87e-9b1429abae20 [Thermothielavioides terrestris]|uniref:J domain-containing protein n=2 Tax=Thermothielavioides terrestris TaxID=2587410 RepID=G2R8E7_THETT|nr:uncharacterized protein THITE_2117631 [Thermothielavioides terrestris NRRL 8126]AEO68205.1 hypothetical protein THITE_2117631 [Thermothielavioides terrestris NRRL 8126]SPQ24551.1 997ae4c3-f94f-4028-b87e-9b1429abae20 [Thermothielavioides terrestris]